MHLEWGSEFNHNKAGLFEDSFFLEVNLTSTPDSYFKKQ